MKRRTFIQQSAAAGLGAMTLPGVAANAMTQKTKHTIGAHVWVFAKDQPGFDVSNILETIWADVKYAGIDAVELMEHPLRRAAKTAEIKELTEKYGIPLLGSSYGANMWDKAKTEEIYEDLDNIMTNMQTTGGRTLGVSVGHPHGRKKTEAEFDTQAALLKRLIRLGDSKGVLLNLHNHTYEVKDDMHDLSATLSRIPNAKLGPDLNWLLRAGIDPVEFLHKFSDQIVFLHLRDQLDSGKWPESLGEGDVDFKVIGKTLKEIKFSGDIVIELAHEDGIPLTRPIKDSLKMSRAYMKETMGV